MTKVVERILNLLAFLLNATRPVSADEIRYTVAGYDQATDESFRRMFERDKDLLRSLGIPLSMQATDHWEVEHGYVVPADDYGMPDPGLTDDELAALALAVQAVRIGGVAPEAGALLKLGGAPFQADGQPLAASLGAEAEAAAEVFGAVQERRTVSFAYRDKPRRLRPYGLVHRRGHWYLLGLESSAKEVRAFRLDRASAVEVGDEPGSFDRPKGFSAADALPDAPWDAGTDDVTATVEFDEEGAWWARRQVTSDATVKATGDGGIRVTMPVANHDAFIGWLIGFDDHAEVIAPAELRQAFVSRVRGDS